ncbi:MAG: TetR/AcrR family transcriptional regulator [Verrucomicrobiota bacterium]
MVPKSVRELGMGRPSKAKERREEILDAFESLIRKHGLEGASMDMIAEEVGCRRGLIRHYLGNREDLVRALVERLIAWGRQNIPSDWDDISSEQIKDGILQELFSPPSEEEEHNQLLLRALWMTHERDELTRKLLGELYEEWLQQLCLGLSKAYPESSREAKNQVAYGLICLADGHFSLESLELRKRGLSQVQRAALQLMDCLEKR